MGHALGYLGHSDYTFDSGDVMYAYEIDNYILTSRDINHIKQFYYYDFYN